MWWTRSNLIIFSLRTEKKVTMDSRCWFSGWGISFDASAEWVGERKPTTFFEYTMKPCRIDYAYFKTPKKQTITNPEFVRQKKGALHANFRDSGERSLTNRISLIINELGLSFFFLLIETKLDFLFWSLMRSRLIIFVVWICGSGQWHSSVKPKATKTIWRAKISILLL